jgi:glutamate-1-semialdehyde 2,1-aminomutase
MKSPGLLRGEEYSLHPVLNDDGSMFLVHMKQTPPRNYRDAYPTPDESRRLKALLEHLYNEGCSIISTGTCVFSTPMTEAEIDTLVGAFESGFAKLASMG